MVFHAEVVVRVGGGQVTDKVPVLSLMLSSVSRVPGILILSIMIPGIVNLSILVPLIVNLSNLVSGIVNTSNQVLGIVNLSILVPLINS